jgi:hypothetical protein
VPELVLGTSTPSTNSALPIPVPSVTTSTTPWWPRAAPKRISAMPAASASFTTVTVPPMALANSAAASAPIHDSSTFAAVWATPCLTTAGKVARPVPFEEGASSPTTSATASGWPGAAWDAVPVGEERAGTGVDGRALDARAADVDAENGGHGAHSRPDRAPVQDTG